MKSHGHSPRHRRRARWSDAQVRRTEKRFGPPAPSLQLPSVPVCQCVSCARVREAA